MVTVPDVTSTLQSGAKWLLRVNNSQLLGVNHWHHFEGAGMDFRDIFLGFW